MIGKRGIFGAVVGAALAAAGCVNCHHEAARTCRLVGPECDAPLADRQHTYVVMVNGLTPEGPSGLIGLRDQLAANGYAKVYYGQLCHAWWFEEEMRRVCREDPSARFALVGYDLGCPTVVGMARAAADKGLPVDVVMLLDPVGMRVGGGCAVRTVVVRSNGAAEPAPNCESVGAPEAGHFTLPTSPRTVATVCKEVKAVAMAVVHPTGYTIGETQDDNALPAPRPLPAGALPPEWQFLDPTPGEPGPTPAPSPGAVPQPIPTSPAPPAAGPIASHGVPIPAAGR